MTNSSERLDAIRKAGYDEGFKDGYNRGVLEARQAEELKRLERDALEVEHRNLDAAARCPLPTGVKNWRKAEQSIWDIPDDTELPSSHNK